MATLRIQELMTEAKKVGKKVTQTQLAKAAGVSQTAIWAIIEGKTKSPNLDILYAIADIFTKTLGRKVALDDLIEQDQGTQSPPQAAGGAIPLYGEDSTPGQLPPDRQPPPSRKQDPLAQGETMRLEHAVPVDDDDFVAVPILGDIPCGTLDQVDPGDVVGYEYMHKDTLGPGEFFLRARGMSMAPRIEDGDLLLIQPGNNWNNGTTVIAYVEGEVTCKKLYLRNGHALLAPTNPNYNHIIVTEEMTIIGKVTKIVKEA